jgi:hypothetical protein
MKMTLRVKICSLKELVPVEKYNHGFEKRLVFEQAAFIILPSKQDC